MQATLFIEWLAFLFGVLQVILALKNKALNFYAGILSVSLYIYIFYTYGLFAESILNIYYLIVSIAGIFLWQNRKILPISYNKQRDWILVILIAMVSWAVLYFILNQYTSSDVPFMDAFVTAVAWAGTWLLIKRKVENWLLLNISNIVAIPLHYSKGLELTALLTCIYFVIAIKGYFEWKKNVGKT